MLVSQFVNSCTTKDYEGNEVELEVRAIVTCKKITPFEGKDVAPPLSIEGDYLVERIYIDKEGNAHLDLGLRSNFNHVTSKETGEILPHSGKGGTHWCHPSRFIVKW